MDLSQWAEQQISIAQLYRNLSQDNPVTLSIVSGGQSFCVLVSHVEPGFNVPLNVVWVCASGNFRGAVLRRVSDSPMPPFSSEWVELQSVVDVFAQAPIWRPQDLQFGEIERFSVGPASTEIAGTFTLTSGQRAVSSDARQMYDAREPLGHTHEPIANRYLRVGDLLIDVGMSDPPKPGYILAITQVDGVLKGEWVELAGTDILYTGPWPVSLSINGPAGPVDEMTQVQFTADVYFEDSSVKRVIPVWSISNALVGTIDSSGVFRSVNVDGDVSLRVDANYYHAETETTLTASFNMTIKDIDSNLVFTSLEIVGPTSVPKNGTATYAAYAVFSNGSRVPVAADLWMLSTSNAGILNQYGVFSAANVIGNVGAKITATYTNKGISKSAILPIEVVDTTVYPQSARIIGPDIVDENTLSLYQFEVTFINGRTQIVAVSDWAHTNQAAGSISNRSGAFLASDLNESTTTTITASFSQDGVTVAASKNITISDTTVYPQAIVIEGADFVYEGRSESYAATVYMTDGTKTTKVNGWDVDSAEFASIDPVSGLLTAVPDVTADQGVVISTSYTLNGKTVSAQKIVSVRTTENVPVSASVSAASAMKVGETISVTFNVTFADGSVVRMKPVWQLSNSNVATITEDGLLTALPVNEVSTVTIQGTYSASGVTVNAQAIVTINDTSAKPVSAYVSGSDSVSTTNSSAYALDVKFSDGATRRVSAVWNSSAPAIASIDNLGILTPYVAGAVTLTGVYSAHGVTVSSTKEVTIK